MKHDEYCLHKLGVVKWIPTCTTVLQNQCILKLPKHIRLLLITNEKLSIPNQFITDVAFSIGIISEQICILKPQEVNLLSNNSYYHSWWFEVKVSRNFYGITLHTLSLHYLMNNSHAKRCLWKQIYNNKYYPFINIGSHYINIII